MIVPNLIGIAAVAGLARLPSALSLPGITGLDNATEDYTISDFPASHLDANGSVALRTCNGWNSDRDRFHIANLTISPSTLVKGQDFTIRYDATLETELMQGKAPYWTGAYAKSKGLRLGRSSLLAPADRDDPDWEKKPKPDNGEFWFCDKIVSHKCPVGPGDIVKVRYTEKVLKHQKSGDFTYRLETYTNRQERRSMVSCVEFHVFVA